MRKLLRPILSLGLCLALSLISISLASDGMTIAQGTMLHAQQVLERYDASGEPLLQYIELWMDASRVAQRQLGEDGRTLSWAFSDGASHLVWDAKTLAARKTEANAAFLMDYDVLKTGFDAETRVPGQVYAGRPCTAILLEDNVNEEEWLKLYLDDETGFVLFCEAPLLRLRTALMETLPTDETRLTPPAGLVF